MTAKNKGIAPDSVLLTRFIILPLLQLTGLSSAKKYNVVILSSSNAGDDDTASFSSGSQSVSDIRWCSAAN